MKKVVLLTCLAASIISSAQKSYFQQEVNYKINVKLDDTKHDLNADETLEYINNSPDELSFIWFHLWPNGYKNNNTPLAKQLIADGNLRFYFASHSERGYIDGLDFKVNGQAVKTEFGESIDMCKLILNEPLKPGGKISITTPFHVHIPIGIFSRLGHIDQQYQITQWYPKPAVYDKYGWHPIPYLNQGEFYSEFGSFDVNITIPKNYVVGATGTLVNGEEETAWLMKNVEETKKIEKFDFNDVTFPPSSSEMKTLHYHASNVHDFGWFADKRYHVLKGEVKLPHSEKMVDTWVMFTSSEGKYWKKAIKYVNDAVYYYSLWNGDYLYPQATAVDGALSAGGGMEYPMITVIGKAGDDKTLDRVIAHEVGHNWFYGMLGSNERDHAWMDEGINSFNENRYMQIKYSSDSTKGSMQAKIKGVNVNLEKILGVPDLDESTLFDLAYRYNALKKETQPVDITAGEYNTLNYGAVVYGRTAVILAYLQAYLGEELYDKCAQKYFDTWQLHHPYPDDIKKVYEEVSKEDLKWFFDELISTTKQIDYKILSYKKSFSFSEYPDSCLSVKIKNKGKIDSPFSISAVKNGKIVSTEWYTGIPFKRDTVSFGNKQLIQKTEFDYLKIDAQNKIPDINRQNNTLKMKGLCKKTESFNLRMLGLIHNTNKTQLFWAPVVAWNEYNHFMGGIAVYNNLLLEKKLEWVLMPMYGFGNKSLAGGGSIHYNIHPNKIFQTIRFGVNAERYCYSNEPLANLNFRKIAPELFLEIKKKHLRNPIHQTILIRHVDIMKDITWEDITFIPPVNVQSTTSSVIHDISYRISDKRKINPFDVSLNIQSGTDFVKSSLTTNYRYTVSKSGKGIDFRFYLGKFLDYKKLTDGNYYFDASGATGGHDYLFDNVFLGRTENKGFMSQQFAETEGNMKAYTPLGSTRDWLTALNINCPLPRKIPFSLFADLTTFSRDSLSKVGANKQYFLYDAGLHFALIKNIVDIYIPLLMSSDVKNTFYTNNSDLKSPTPDNPDPDKVKRTIRMIRFTFNIQKLNPFELVRNLTL